MTPTSDECELHHLKLKNEIMEEINCDVDKRIKERCDSQEQQIELLINVVNDFAESVEKLRQSLDDVKMKFIEVLVVILVALIGVIAAILW